MFLFVLVDFRNSFISRLGDDFKAFLRIVCHWRNFTEGGIILRPNLFRIMKIVDSVPEKGISSQRRI